MTKNVLIVVLKLLNVLYVQLEKTELTVFLIAPVKKVIIMTLTTKIAYNVLSDVYLVKMKTNVLNVIQT